MEFMLLKQFLCDLYGLKSHKLKQHFFTFHT